MMWLNLEVLVIGFVTFFLFSVVHEFEQHFPHATLLKIAILGVGAVAILHKFSLMWEMI